MNRPRFLLDMDGVIYDFHSAFRFLANQEFRINLPRVEDIWGEWDGHLQYMTKTQDDWMWEVGVRRGLFRHGHVRRGAIEFCRELDNYADIVLVTHRPLQARQDTLDWVAFHKIPTSEIHMLHRGQDKGRVPGDYALDDKPSNVEAFQRAGVEAGVWARPWNTKSKLQPRFYDWGEVLDWVR